MRDVRRPLMYGQRHDDAERVSETECGRVPAVLVCVRRRPAMNHSLIIYARVGYERRGRGRGGRRRRRRRAMALSRLTSDFLEAGVLTC